MTHSSVSGLLVYICALCVSFTCLLGFQFQLIIGIKSCLGCLWGDIGACDIYIQYMHNTDYATHELTAHECCHGAVSGLHINLGPFSSEHTGRSRLESAAMVFHSSTVSSRQGSQDIWPVHALYLTLDFLHASAPLCGSTAGPDSHHRHYRTQVLLQLQCKLPNGAAAEATNDCLTSHPSFGNSPKCCTCPFFVSCTCKDKDCQLKGDQKRGLRPLVRGRSP